MVWLGLLTEPQGTRGKYGQRLPQGQETRASVEHA